MSSHVLTVRIYVHTVRIIRFNSNITPKHETYNICTVDLSVGFICRVTFVRRLPRHSEFVSDETQQTSSLYRYCSFSTGFASLDCRDTRHTIGGYIFSFVPLWMRSQCRLETWRRHVAVRVRRGHAETPISFRPIISFVETGLTACGRTGFSCFSLLSVITSSNKYRARTALRTPYTTVEI